MTTENNKQSPWVPRHISSRLLMKVILNQSGLDQMIGVTAYTKIIIETDIAKNAQIIEIYPIICAFLAIISCCF